MQKKIVFLSHKNTLFLKKWTVVKKNGKLEQMHLGMINTVVKFQREKRDDNGDIWSLHLEIVIYFSNLRITHVFNLID